MIHPYWWIEIALVIACTIALALIVPDVTPRRAKRGEPEKPVTARESTPLVVPLSSR